MAEVFDVVYNIQVISEQATLGINKFNQACAGLTKASAALEKFAATFNQISALNQKGFTLNVKTDVALKRLDAVLNKIGQIKNAASKINLGVQGGTAGKVNRTATAKPQSVIAPSPVRQQQPRQTAAAPRPQNVWKGARPYNYQYPLWGPARMGNVATLDLFKGMGLMYGISAIGSGVRDILSTSAEYQNVMQTAKNILKTNYTGKNFNASFAEMERIARQVGVETKFTAPEVADAVKFLAMAGLPMDAIKKSIRPIADIALIGDTDLGTTADVMTNIMTAYGIKPENMRKTADVMTRTFTMSNTTLMELAESFKMSGSMLHLANVPFETAAAAFGVLGDAGIKATMAGTAMRTIMNNLRNPTKAQKSYWETLGIRRFDEFGNLREINEIFADLYRVNGSDERAAEARKQYEELQRKYAPQFEGLTEGTAQYNNLLAQYDKESEAIRRQFGGVDVFRLFRMTAAPTAGVLMSQVEKWNKIIEENFLSDGLSKKLADEKKNQIVGLCAQFKSAFQEQGLQIFEENEGKIRSYLDSAIAWVKSADFKNILAGVVDLADTLIKSVLRFTKLIVDLYHKFEPLVKLYLRIQLPLRMFRSFLDSIVQVGRTALFTVLRLFNPLGGRMPMQYGLTGMASPTGLLSGTAGGLLYYGIPQKWMSKGFSTLLETSSPVAAVKAASGYDPMNHMANAALLRKYQATNKRIQALNRYSGLGMMGGALLGGVIGNNFDTDNGMMWGSMIGMGLGSMAPLLAGSGPWGWAIGGAVVAITGITSAVVKYQREIAKAKQDTESYIASLRTLNIGKMDLSSADAVFNANIRITTSLLHTENEKLELQAELWKRIREEREGTQDSYDKKTSRDVIQQMKDYRNKYWYSDLWASSSKQDAFALQRNALLKELENAGVFSSVQFNERDARNRYRLVDANGNEAVYTGLMNGKNYNAWDKEYINSFAALSAAFNPENPYVNMARNSLLSKMLSLKSVEGYNDAIAQFWNEFGFSIDQSKNINTLKDSDFDALLSDNGLLEYAEYGVPIMKQLESIAKGFEAQKELLELVNGFDFEANNLVLPMANTQKVLNTFIGELFDPSRFGQFGTYDWLNKVRDYANSTTLGIDQFGNLVDVPVFAGGLEGEMFNQQVQEVYGKFLGFFEKLPKEIQPFYYPYLDKGYWESLGGGVNLGEYNGLSSDLQKKFGALKVTPAPFLSPLMFQNDTLPDNGFDRPLYYPNSLPSPNSINEALTISNNRKAVAQQNTTINIHFDKAINVENVNENDWNSAETWRQMAQVVMDVLEGAAEQTFLTPNEMCV